MIPEEMTDLLLGDSSDSSDSSDSAVTIRPGATEEISVIRPVLKIADDSKLDAFLDGRERPDHLDE